MSFTYDVSVMIYLEYVDKSSMSSKIITEILLVQNCHFILIVCVYQMTKCNNSPIACCIPLYHCNDVL